MFTKIRLILITAATGIVLAVPTVASAAIRTRRESASTASSRCEAVPRRLRPDTEGWVRSSQTPSASTAFASQEVGTAARPAPQTMFERAAHEAARGRSSGRGGGGAAPATSRRARSPR